MLVCSNQYALTLQHALGRALEREDAVTRERDRLLKERNKLRKQLKDK